jgi:hypothetical protein
MNFLLSLLFLILGIIFAIAGKDIVTVCACFLVYGILQGVNELSLMRQEMERWEEDE